MADEAETTALVARFTNAPTAGRKNSINTLIAALKAASVWTKLDALYVMAAADTQAAQRNWIADSFNLSVGGGAPTFTADQGYTGDGNGSGTGTAYLATGFNPTTATTPQFARDSAHIGAWSKTSGQDGGREIGYSGAVLTSIGCRDSVDNFDARVNNAGSALTGAFKVTNTDGSGHFVGSRTASNALASYRNGVSLKTGTTASAALFNDSFTLLQANLGFSNRQLAAAHFGSGLADQNVSDLYTALNAYMTAILTDASYVPPSDTPTRGGHGNKRKDDDYDRPYLSEFREALDRVRKVRETAERAKTAAESRDLDRAKDEARAAQALIEAEAEDAAEWSRIGETAKSLSKQRVKAERALRLATTLLSRAIELERQAQVRLDHERAEAQRRTEEVRQEMHRRALQDDEDAIAFLLMTH